MVWGKLFPRNDTMHPIVQTKIYNLIKTNRLEKAKRAGPTRRGACDAGNKGNDKGNREERLRFEIEDSGLC